MKRKIKVSKKYLILPLGIGSSILFFGLTIGLSSCSHVGDFNEFKNNLIQQDTKNTQTNLINNLSLSIKESNSNESYYGTGFVFDENINANGNLKTFYIMTNFHVYNDIDKTLNNHLYLSNCLIGQEVSSWNYEVSNFNFNLASDGGDVYLINNPTAKANYDIAVYQVSVNMTDNYLPTPFKYFDEHKEEINYVSDYYSNNTGESKLLTAAGYPFNKNKAYYRQYSNNALKTISFMDPLLTNYPSLNNDNSFNNEMIGVVKDMDLDKGASGSLVLDNSNNSLLGIYFGFIKLKDQPSYGLFIPFKVTENYYHVTFNYLNKRTNKLISCYFNVVNLNDSTNPSVQASEWINNSYYEKNNYNNLIDATLIKNGIAGNLSTNDLISLLKNNPKLHISLTANGPDNAISIANNVSVKDILDNASNIQVNYVNNEQNIFKSWLNIHSKINQKDKTFLSTKDLS